MKKFFYSLLVLIIIVIIFLYTKFIEKDPPVISVSLREIEVNDDSVKLSWHVKNLSDYEITFDENNIMLVYIKNKQLTYDIPKTALSPNEEFIKEFVVKDSNPGYSTPIKATAKSNNGTTLSMKITVQHQCY